MKQIKAWAIVGKKQRGQVLFHHNWWIKVFERKSEAEGYLYGNPGEVPEKIVPVKIKCQKKKTK